MSWTLHGKCGKCKYRVKQALEPISGAFHFKSMIGAYKCATDERVKTKDRTGAGAGVAVGPSESALRRQDFTSDCRTDVKTKKVVRSVEQT